ncbi:MAG: hypothetical protein ACI8Y4_004745 [Candidatus Poriferisodalaceae bacterium]|jgi:hypothetical protein
MAPTPQDADGLSLLAQVNESGFTLFTVGGEIDFLTGVNIGSAIPGRLPSELEADAAT